MPHYFPLIWNEKSLIPTSLCEIQVKVMTKFPLLAGTPTSQFRTGLLIDNCISHYSLCATSVSAAGVHISGLARDGCVLADGAQASPPDMWLPVGGWSWGILLPLMHTCVCKPLHPCSSNTSLCSTVSISPVHWALGFSASHHCLKYNLYIYIPLKVVYAFNNPLVVWPHKLLSHSYFSLEIHQRMKDQVRGGWRLTKPGTWRNWGRGNRVKIRKRR